VAAVIAPFLTSKVFSDLQAETMGWKYGSICVIFSSKLDRKWKSKLTSRNKSNKRESQPVPSMFESNVENPRRLSANVRYP
jgi:hypothetical protein